MHDGWLVSLTVVTILQRSSQKNVIKLSLLQNFSNLHICFLICNFHELFEVHQTLMFYTININHFSCQQYLNKLGRIQAKEQKAI